MKKLLFGAFSFRHKQFIFQIDDFVIHLVMQEVRDSLINHKGNDCIGTCLDQIKR